MKAQIDQYGQLYLEKRGKLVNQKCPYSASTTISEDKCGEWCPFFFVYDKATEREALNFGNKRISSYYYVIKVCNDQAFQIHPDDMTIKEPLNA